MIPFSCDECDKALRVRDELAGKRIKCPGCGATIEVPIPEAEAEEVEPPRKKRSSSAVSAKRSRPPVDDEPDEEDERPSRKKSKKGDSAGKPSVVLMIAGISLALIGLIAMAAFILFAKRVGDDIDGKKFTLEQLEKDLRDNPNGLPDRVATLKTSIDQHTREVNDLRSRASRNTIFAIVFGIMFLAGVGLRGYHHFKMKRWHLEHHGIGKKKRKRDDKEEGEEQDED